MNRQFGNSQPGNNKLGSAQSGNIQPGHIQPGNIQLGNIQSGNLDVIGRAQGLQIRLKKVGAFFTQEIVYPGDTDPLVGGDDKDIHVIVDGVEIHSAYSYAGVSQKPQGSLYLQAVLENADFSVETNFKLSVRSGFLDIETIFMAHRPLVLSAIENNYRFWSAGGAGRMADAAGVEVAGGAANAANAANAASAVGPNLDAKYVWLPHLKKEAGHVAGQHSFRSPCAFLQQGEDVFAVIPSLTVLNESWKDNWRLPAILDYKDPNCLRFGLATHAASYRPGENLYFCRQPLPAKESSDGLNLSKGDKVSYRFSLMLRKDGSAGTAQREIVRFIWEKYGVQLLDDGWQQYLRFDDCVRYAYDALFDRYRAWRVFSLRGSDCGGTVALITRKHEGTFQNQSDNKFAAEIPWKQYLLDRHGRNKLGLAAKWLFEGTLERVYFDARHNNLRTACGFAYFGARWNDQRLMDAARRTVNLYLAAPETEEGLRPAVFSIGSRPGWLNGADGWAISEAFGVADLAEAGYWLLNYGLLCGGGMGASQVLEVCGKIAECILKKQSEAGFYRRYFLKSTSEHPLESTNENMSTPEQRWFSVNATVAAGRFMAAMAQHTGDSHLLAGAVKVAHFIVDRVLPEHNWNGQSTSADYYGGLKLQNCNVIYLAADLFRIIAKVTGEKCWLDSGTAILDDLLLYQQLWTPPHLLVDGAGGFGAGNSEGVWNSPIQAMIALLLMDWYELSGEKEYFERGILALRAAYAAMLVPENKLLHEELHSQFGTADYGIISDNYAYAGSDTGVGVRVTPGWGCGTACAMTALAQKHYGDVYIDIPRQKAFGINGCRVKEALISPARVALSLETMPAYLEPKHCNSLDPILTGALILKFRIGSENGGKFAGGGGNSGKERETIMDGEVMQVSVNGEHLGYYSAAQLREGISWDWRRHQSVLAEAAQKVNVERAFVGKQEVELGGFAEDSSGNENLVVNANDYADENPGEYVADSANDKAEDQVVDMVDSKVDEKVDNKVEDQVDENLEEHVNDAADDMPADNTDELSDKKADENPGEKGPNTGDSVEVIGDSAEADNAEADSAEAGSAEMDNAEEVNAEEDSGDEGAEQNL